MDDDFDLASDDNVEKNVLTNPVKNKRRSILAGIYSKIYTYERHYNIIKARHKQLAAFWLLTTFLGFSYILAGKEIGSPFNITVGIMIISLMSSQGPLLLWFLDAGIYHRLLNAGFKEAYKLEETKSVKSRIHHSMIATLLNKNIDPVIYDGIFYMIWCTVLWLVAGAALFMTFYPNDRVLAAAIGSIWLLSVIIIDWLMLRFTYRSGINQFNKESDKIKRPEIKRK